MMADEHETARSDPGLADSLLDALVQHVAILDESARIVAVNQAWRRFAEDNRANASTVATGVDYLQICDAATGGWSREAPLVAEAIREIILGRRDLFHCEYPCHSPREKRWFRLHITPFTRDGRRRLAVVHDNITDRRLAEVSLEQRIKELDCLYGITELMNTADCSVEEVLQRTVELIPASWPYPGAAAARIVLSGRTFDGRGGAEPRSTLRAEMLISGSPVGEVEICLQEAMPAAGEVASVDQGRTLLGAIAELLGRFVEREQARETLELNEARLNSLLGLFQKSTELGEAEIIQLALEEAVDLTASAIGYCHLVHQDQEAIELVTWSRATLEVCDAVHDKHYPLAEAGVWADCARIKAPVVHNDYPSAPNRKGLPEGHAELTRHLSVPVVEESAVRVIMGVGNKSDDYDESDVRQLQLVANDMWQIVRRKRLEGQLRIMATTDALTGLHNRRSFFDRLEEEVRRVQRYGGPLSVLMIDVDTFKVVNDTYGHDVGDSVLRELAATVRRSLRDVDIVGRVGGEEFAIVSPNTSHEEARALAERLVCEVRGLRFEASGASFGITASIGAASWHESLQTSEALLKAADVALYRAKESGRDRVVG